MIENISIDTGYFYENTQNGGVVNTAVFADSAENSGTITTTAQFSGTSINSGVVLSAAKFFESTTNSGSISGTAVFSGSAENTTGTVQGAAVFLDTAVNTGTISGAVVFTGTSVNNGVVAEAIFIGSSQNGGTVTSNAIFADNAGNLSTGLVAGSAVFALNSVNAGTVQGDAAVAETANGAQGTVQGTTTTYIQPDGAYIYGYFSGGVKTAPQNYQLLAYNILDFWYGYDNLGNAQLANGIYSDGTFYYMFENGFKGAIEPYQFYSHVLSNVSLYSIDASLINNLSVMYNDIENTGQTRASYLSGLSSPLNGNVSPALWSTNADGVISWSTDNVFSLELDGGATYYYISPLVSGQTILRNSDGASVQLLSGVHNIDGDAFADNWSTDTDGVLTWTPIMGNSIVLGGTPYYYSGEIVSGETIVYTDEAMQTPATEASGLQDTDADNIMDERWSINSSGVLTFVTVYQYIIGANTFYSVNSTLNSVDLPVLYNADGSNPSDSGPNYNDVDGDGILDEWFITSGVIGWTPSNPVNVGGTDYYFFDASISTSTAFYNSDGTAASSIVASLVNYNNLDYFYFDASISTSTAFYNSDGTTSELVAKEITFALMGGGDGATFFWFDSSITTGTLLYDNTGSTVGTPSNPIEVMLDNVPHYVFNTGFDSELFESDGTNIGILTNNFLNGQYMYVGNLVSGTTVIYNSDGSIASGQSGSEDVDGDTVLDSWSTNQFGVITFAPSGYQITIGTNTYYSSTIQSNADLVSTSSVLYSDQATTTPASEASGFNDVDGDGTVDKWSINSSGVITFDPLNAITIGTDVYYSTTLQGNLVNGESVLYSENAGAWNLASESGGGFADVNGDGTTDKWSINSSGVIAFDPLNVITIGSDTYYSTTLQGNLVNGESIVYSDTYGTYANLTDVFADATNNGTPDKININSTTGVISWTPLNQIATVEGNTYYSETASADLVSGTSVLRGSNGALAASIAGPNYNDVNGDGTPDNWSTNENGEITWTELNPIITVGSNTYYSDPAGPADLVSGQSVLRNPDGSGLSNSGPNYSDINADGTPDSWTTNEFGVIYWTELNEIIIGESTYYSETDQANLVSGTSVLRNADGSEVSNELGLNDVNGDTELDIWTITSGIIFFYSMYEITIGVNTYYSGIPQASLISGTSVIYTDRQGSKAAMNGFDDVDGDGTTDKWSTDGESGVITFDPLISFQIDGMDYYSITPQADLVSGSSVVYSDQNGTYATGSGYSDVNGDSVSESWSFNNQGVISWTTAVQFSIGANTYYSEVPQADLVSETSILYSNEELTTPASTASGVNDVNGDGDLESWSIGESGAITFYPLNEITIGTNVYYSAQQQSSLDQGTLLYSDRQGTPASANSGINDVNLDSAPEQWTISENGAITWTELTSFTLNYSDSSNASVYSVDSQGNLVSGTSVLYNSTGGFATEGTGIGDVNLDGTVDEWTIDNESKITWTAANYYGAVLGFDLENPVSINLYYIGTSFVDGIVIYNADGTILANASGLYDSENQWSTDQDGVITSSAYNP